MKILAFDTSNIPLTVALVEDGTLKAEKTINIRQNHSIQLMPTVQSLLADCRWQPQDLDRIVVAAGPGSYTGLRLGATVAKTLAWTLEVELVAVSSLKALAATAERKTDHVIAPIFDARRGNIYTGLYRQNAAGNLEKVEPEVHISLEKWLDYLKEQSVDVEFVGLDVETYLMRIQEVLGESAYYSKKISHIPNAFQLARLSEFEKGIEPHTFVPNYLRLAEAEANWLDEHPEYKGESLVEQT